MPLPSLYVSQNAARPWSVARAAAYGAGIGALAGAFKVFAALHQTLSVTALPKIAAVAVAFALLCAGAAALRNFLGRRFIWPT